jgi:hypothetical protein
MYGFTFVVEGFDLDDEVQNAALAYLPFDAVVGQANGVLSVDFECDGMDPSAAVMLAYAEMQKIRVRVRRIDLDLVGVSDIAERAGISRERARLWTTGARRTDFPLPYSTVGSSRVWVWSDVHPWLIENNIELDGMFDWSPLPLNVIEAFNGAFAQQGELTTEWLRPTTPAANVRMTSVGSLVAKTGWKEFSHQ